MIRPLLLLIALIAILFANLVTVSPERFGVEGHFPHAIEVAEDYKNPENQPHLRQLKLLDLFAGTAALSLSFLGAFLLLRIRKFSDFLLIQTPRNKATIYVALNLVWLATIPSPIYYYSYRLHRGDYPILADSISIPIVTGAIFTLFLLPFLNLLVFWALRKKSLPCRVFTRFNSDSPEIVFFLLFLLIGLILFEQVRDGDIFGISITLVMLYLFVSCRACQASPSSTEPKGA